MKFTEEEIKLAEKIMHNMHEKYIKTMIQSTTMAINASHDCKQELSSKSPGADNSYLIML